MQTFKTTLTLVVMATGIVASTPAQAQTSLTSSPQQRYAVQLPGARVKGYGPYPVTTGVGKGTRLLSYAVVFPRRPGRPGRGFVYFVQTGSPSMAVTRALNARSFAVYSQPPSFTATRTSVMQHNGDWSVVTQVSEGCRSSIRGGYVGRTVLVVIAPGHLNAAQDPRCGGMTATRDSIYTALRARAAAQS